MQIDVTMANTVKVAEIAKSNEQKTDERCRWFSTTPRYVWEDKSEIRCDYVDHV